MKQAVLTSKVRGITENSLLFNFEGPKRSGGIAQLGEHLLCKQGVSGSIPLISTMDESPKNPFRLRELSRNQYGLIAQPVRASA